MIKSTIPIQKKLTEIEMDIAATPAMLETKLN